MVALNDPNLIKSVEITRMLMNGSPILNNPVSNDIGTASSMTSDIVGRLKEFIPTSEDTDEGSTSEGETISEEDKAIIQNTINMLGDKEENDGSNPTLPMSLIGRLGQLSSHTNRLIHGDNSGLITSGGLVSNLGIAMNSKCLNDMLNPPTEGTNPCGLIEDLLGSILGAGAAILGGLLSALARLAELVAGTLSSILSGIGSIINDIAGFITDIADLILNEVNKFTAWLQNLLNYSLGGFLVNLDRSDPCNSLVFDAIKTPILENILNG